MNKCGRYREENSVPGHLHAQPIDTMSGKKRVDAYRSRYTNDFSEYFSRTETKVDMSQCLELVRLYHSKPALVSAKMVLHAQLLSGGLVLRRNGKPVELQPSFQRHVDRCWLPFARAVIDSIMSLGYCVVSYEVDNVSYNRIRLPNMHTEKRSDHDVREKSSGSVKNGQSNTVIPNVATLGSYQLAFDESGENGYARTYHVYSKSAGYSAVRDENVRIFVRDAPDSMGNVNSTISSTASLNRFTDSMVDLALKCEIGRVAPAVVTQERRQGGGAGASNPRDMFFDSESRGIHADAVRTEDEESAMALRLQMLFCKSNNARTSFDPLKGTSTDRDTGGGSVIDPPMLTLPKSQELASYPLPQARTDLGDLLRFTQDQMCTAMGVPSALLFESRFSGKSTAQLSLLNATIQQLAAMVNIVLTQAYHDIYGGGSEKDDVHFVTTVSPLASADEVMKLFAGGLADFKVAAPLALHAVGASNSEIQEALQRREEMENRGLVDPHFNAQPESEKTAQPGGTGDTTHTQTKREGAVGAASDHDAEKESVKRKR